MKDTMRKYAALSLLAVGLAGCSLFSKYASNPAAGQVAGQDVALAVNAVQCVVQAYEGSSSVKDPVQRAQAVEAALQVCTAEYGPQVESAVKAGKAAVKPAK